MNSVLLITSVVATSAALLAWFAIDVGTTSLARYRTQFTEQARLQE